MNTPEKIAAAYLRLNGFLLLPNFTVLDGPHHNEVDLVGVRAPHAREGVDGRWFPTDKTFLQELAVDDHWLAVATQVKGNDDLDFPPVEHLAYIQSFVGDGTRIRRLAFTHRAVAVKSTERGIEVGLAHAVSWMWARFDWMDNNLDHLKKEGSWTWSEPFIGDLLILRRAGLSPSTTRGA